MQFPQDHVHFLSLQEVVHLTNLYHEVPIVESIAI